MIGEFKMAAGDVICIVGEVMKCMYISKGIKTYIHTHTYIHTYIHTYRHTHTVSSLQYDAQNMYLPKLIIKMCDL